MYEIKITGTTVDEVKASVFDLSKLLAQSIEAVATPIAAPVIPAPAAPVNPTQAAAPTTANTQLPAATAPVPASSPAPVPTAAPPIVPTAAAPTYNRDQIMTAGAALIDAGKINELMGLLNAFGVQAVTQLKQDQLGAFATELRKLGAQI